ncbi:MAG: hypothetical protein ACJ8CR_01245 [Roseiflexaceae bacterium]
MTEREHDRDMLAELRELSGPAPKRLIGAGPILTRRDELKLLAEANRVETPTLAPANIHLEHRELSGAGGKHTTTPMSFGIEAIDVVRRHPLPALLLTMGLAYLLLRRKT